MRPVDKSNPEGKTEYIPYGSAKHMLIECIGSYCSYCERQGFSTALDVEHVEDKNANPDKKYFWSNFLLACKNCNSIKGTAVVDFENICLPHLNNTFPILKYLESGLIQVNPDFEQPRKAMELVNLIGLDRRPGHSRYSNKDNRWEERKKVWELAKRYVSKYKNSSFDVEIIIDLALAYGFFSIWMHAFKKYPEVQSLLIDAFPGTKYKDEILANQADL